MKQLDICNRCGSKKIMGPFDRTENTGVLVDTVGSHTTKEITLSAFFCLDCGYVENYVSQHDLIGLKEFMRLTGEIE